MKQFVLFYFLLVIIAINSHAQEGATLFRQNCSACHQIGRGRLVGPDLQNVHERRSDEWIHNFIRSSQSVIKSGDQQAVELFNEYNKIVMPDNTHLSDEDINAIIAYIKAGGGEPAATTASPASKSPPQPIAKPESRTEITGEQLEELTRREAHEERSERLTSMFFRHVVITLFGLSIMFTLLILLVLKNKANRYKNNRNTAGNIR